MAGGDGMVQTTCTFARAAASTGFNCATNVLARHGGCTIVSLLRRGGRVPKPPARVLVVEDEADIAALIAYQLTREGYRVETALTGTVALDAVHRDLPDLIVLDRMLPGISGRRGAAVAARQRSHAQRSDPHPDGQARTAGPDHGVRAGRRRLPDQAVQPARAGAAGGRHPAPRPGRAQPVTGGGRICARVRCASTSARTSFRSTATSFRLRRRSSACCAC